MKRLIISALCVSIFFIGLGSIVEKTSAKFSSDDKAMELIRNARAAIGGDVNINEVKSMTIVATTTNFFEKNGVQDVKQGSMEVNMKLPGQFSKKVKIGNPGDAAGVNVVSDTDFVFMKKDGETIDFTSKDGVKKKGVFVIKRGEDGNVEWKSDDADGKVKVEGNKVIITKDDGTTEEIDLEGKNKFRVKIDGEGDGSFISDDGNVSKVIVMKDKDGKVLSENIVGPKKIRFTHGGHTSDMLRTTMAILLTAPEGSNVSYKYVGSGNVDGNASNIVEVSANGSSFKLYLDASTNLPQMISYQSNQNMFFFSRDKVKDMSNDALIKMKKGMNKSVEHQIKFSDFRSVGNLLLPHSWTKTVAGKPSQNTNVTSYELNPANIDEKFGKGKVYFRKK